MSRCRSGDICFADAGHGRTGRFCEAHARQLAEIRDRGSEPQRRKAPGAKPTTPERLPRATRAARVAQHIHEFGVASRAEASKAAGVSLPALAPILRIARDERWIETRGNAYVPGPVTPPADVVKPEERPT